MSKGTVRVTGLNLRASPKDGRVLASLRRSTRLEILGEETWYRVRTSRGVEGYVFGDFVERDLLDEAAGPVGNAPPVVGSRYEETHFHHDRFVGKVVVADVDFVPALDRVARYAEEEGVQIHVTSSSRSSTDVAGAIVDPARKSNHLVGHAIDMNVWGGDGRLYNSKALSRLGQTPGDVRAFINAIRADSELRWGGDFRKRDPVHIDDDLYHRDPTRWESKLASRAGR